MTDNGKDRAQKAFKSVEKAAAKARTVVIGAMREARAETRRNEQITLAKEVKRLKREENLSNGTIADELDISESTVRALLAMRIPGE